MSWLARLKSEQYAKTDATKPTKTLFVGFVAPTLASLQKNEGSRAKRDISKNGQVGTDTIRPAGLSPKLLAASLALDAEVAAHGAPDPASYCWPHSTAMNAVEIDLFMDRLHRFTGKGLATDDAESMADHLVTRDREEDDRRSCLECKHLGGTSQAGWRCGNWQAAGIASRKSDAQLSPELVNRLQRCDGFTAG